MKLTLTLLPALLLVPLAALHAENDWRPERARQDRRDFLEKSRGCHVEVIMKDISTVRRQPQRRWAWAALAMQEAEAML